jgi:biotin carboxyl carrier protein
VFKEPGLVRRLLANAWPQLAEDWQGTPGIRFRKGFKRVSDYFSENVKPGERLREAPDMVWKAADGLASEKHAKAEADYAKAENDRMEAELRRRTLEAKTRHECADADKAEAEAGIAKIREMQARIDLYRSLKDAGVSVELGPDLIISALPLIPAAFPQSAAAVITAAEKDEVRARLVNVVFQPENVDAEDLTLYDWSCQEGDRIAAGLPICEVSALIPASPVYTTRWQIQSPASGTVLEVFFSQGTPINSGDVLATILPDSDVHPQVV